MTVPKHIEVMADDFARRRFHSYAWPEDIEDATAVHAALVEAGFVVLPVGLSSDQIKAANATAERGMIAAAEK